MIVAVLLAAGAVPPPAGLAAPPPPPPAKAALPTTPPPDLMQGLAAQAARLQRGFEELSIEVTVNYRELGRKGQIVHEGRSTSVIDLHGKQRVTRVLRATRDGKEALVEAQKEAAENDRNGRKPEGPFEAWNQPRHRFSVLGTTPEGLWRLGVEPAGDKAHDVFEGQAVVDPLAGEAVQVSVHPSKLPTFVDRLEFVVDYGTRLPGIGRMPSRVTVDGEGGFLFFRKHEWIAIAIKYLAVGGKPVAGQ